MKLVINEQVRKYLTDDEYKYLLLLEFNHKFELEIIKIRVRLKMYTKLDQKFFSKLAKYTKVMMRKLSIPLNLHEVIESIIIDGHVYASKSPIFLYHPSEVREQKIGNFIIPAADPDFPFIQLRKHISKGEMVKAIKEMWKDIEGIMDTFDQSSPAPKLVKHISVRDIEEDILIYRYGQSGRKPNHQKIQQLLQTKHKIFLDEATIRKKYSTMGKLLKELNFI